ncbi:hypothetical protein B0O99DRAFT_514882 [Bisporella sp. PMI_857]|nr:hypothetical protein B0O99DRAFT_514882 [Bisporella sp. PMI_857]
MADDIDVQVRRYIREILHLVLNVKSETFKELNELVGQTSEFELRFVTVVYAKIIIV